MILVSLTLHLPNLICRPTSMTVLIIVNNTAQLCLPSGAPVQCLFSIGVQILTPCRNDLTDFHFEMLLLLCANTRFTDK